jgi:IPT/TIG domain
MRHKHFPVSMFVLLAMVLAFYPAISFRTIQPGTAGTQVPILRKPSLWIATGQSQNLKPQPPVSNTAASVPVLYFTDITSGPKSGNSDTSGGRSGLDGAIITLWGTNLGGTQGSSKVYINGIEAASTYSWGNATASADLVTFHHMQKIACQVSHLAQDGTGSIEVVVNGKISNSLPFTVRDGYIFFVTINGNDDTGDGSWGNPWRTIPKAAGSLAPGDIAYIGDGVDQTTETDYGAAVNLGRDGEPGRPNALVVYPGATSQVGNTALSRAFHVWNRDTGSYSKHWVIAGFRMTTAEVGVTAQGGFRVVGNYVTAPNGDGMDGAIGGVNGSDIFIVGNELEHIGSADCSKLYHAIYISGVRQDAAPRAPTESNREVAWNYLHDNLSNRAINIYSEQEYSAFIQQQRIHDNVIVNQRGDGIMLGYYVTGDNWVYNNLVINAGLGPEWSDDPSYHTGIRINTGHEAVSQTGVYIYNNTLYGNGWSGAVVPEESGGVLFDPGALERSTTVEFNNNIIYSTGEPYLAGESAALPIGDHRTCWYGMGASPAWDTSAINLDPNFVGAGVFNFQLQNGSPCIDAGKNVATVVSRDLYGVLRPQGLGFDIGAFEYITGTVISRIGMYLPLVLR